MQYRKAQDIVQKIEISNRKVLEAFEICPEIQKVAILFGATSVSPKEVYVIEMPPLNPEAENLPSKACIKTLFRHLLAEDPLRDMKQISSTSISVLLYAPRHSGLHSFFPKPVYNIPERGFHVNFNLNSSCGHGNHDLSKDFSVIELSGFEPFDTSCDVSVSSWTPLKQHSSSEESVSADYVCIESVESMDIVDDCFLNQNISCNYTEHHVDSSGDRESTSGAANSCKRLKKSSSASSILSQSSVIAKSQLSFGCQKVDFESADTGIFSFTESEYIWFQSPVTMKGYKTQAKS